MSNRPGQGLNWTLGVEEETLSTDLTRTSVKKHNHIYDLYAVMKPVASKIYKLGEPW
jgi:hypothetical protein